eukprot:scaffold8989_cov93-Isochrysis_galbana.AAC.2
MDLCSSAPAVSCCGGQQRSCRAPSCQTLFSSSRALRLTTRPTRSNALTALQLPQQPAWYSAAPSSHSLDSGLWAGIDRAAHASAALMLPITFLALAWITSHLFPAMASGVKRGATRPTEVAPALMKSPALSRSTPEVGLSFKKGSADETALIQAAPPATPGKIFWEGAPAL